MSTLRLAQVRVRFEALDDGAAPSFPGAAFRGALGRALRHLACITEAPACDGCPSAPGCAFGYLFETPVPPGAQRLRRYPFAPHPVVLQPPGPVPRWRRGDSVILGVLLFGRGADHLPSVMLALREMGADGIGPDRVALELVEAELLTPRPRGLYRDGQLAPGPYGVPLADLVGSVSAGPAHLRFLSPTRIVYAGQPARELPLHVLARSLLRRISSLAYFHGEYELRIDFAGLLQQAGQISVSRQDLRWVEQHRHSRRQGRIHPLSGAVGEVAFAHVSQEIGELLALGELTHVGKGTAFGLGRYQRSAA